jgi:hypothetical protein
MNNSPSTQPQDSGRNYLEDLQALVEIQKAHSDKKLHPGEDLGRLLRALASDARERIVVLDQNGEMDISGLVFKLTGIERREAMPQYLEKVSLSYEKQNTIGLNDYLREAEILLLLGKDEKAQESQGRIDINTATMGLVRRLMAVMRRMSVSNLDRDNADRIAHIIFELTNIPRKGNSLGQYLSRIIENHRNEEIRGRTRTTPPFGSGSSESRASV